ncbi:hypothetical protein DL96DRAFT_1621781 [Flagelloscypha sp. PMI_526]|nr:hypothetical protein DL96DRAFT_1621781 [Flagelloscypha sp. PMI_526]
MDQCLQLQELREAICAACQPSLFTLVQLAATSTLFHQPAIQQLWAYATLPSLLRLSPAAQSSVRDSRVILERPWVLSDWDRVTHYSVHVKVLSAYDSAIGVNPADEGTVMESMTSSMPPRLFPLLMVLYADLKTPFLQIFGSQIFVSELLEVTINHDAKADHLLRPCSRLEKLTFSADEEEIDSTLEFGNYMTSVTQIISWHPQLTTLRVEQLDVATFVRVATTLPNLTSLQVMKNRALKKNLPENGSLKSTFPKLSDLDFADTFHNAVGILKTASLSPLRALRFGVAGIIPGSNMWGDILPCLSPWSNTLERLDVTPWESVLDPAGVSLHTLRPLLSLHNLRFLSLQRRVNLFDTDMDDFAAAFPRLEAVELSSPELNSSLTLRCLVSFAWYCHDLCRIQIELNAEGWEDVHSSLISRPSSNRQAVVVETATCRIQNGTEDNVLDAFLVTFPNAVQISDTWSMEMEDGWAAVARALSLRRETQG